MIVSEGFAPIGLDLLLDCRGIFCCCNLGCSCELSLTNFWHKFKGIVDTAGGADGRM